MGQAQGQQQAQVPSNFNPNIVENLLLKLLSPVGGDNPNIARQQQRQETIMQWAMRNRAIVFDDMNDPIFKEKFGDLPGQQQVERIFLAHGGRDGIDAIDPPFGGQDIRQTRPSFPLALK